MKDKNINQGVIVKDLFNIEETKYVLIDDGRWEDDEWVHEQAELSVCENLIGKVSE